MKVQKEVVPVLESKNVIVGDAKAALLLMEFGDYESEACANANEVVSQILKNYEGVVKFNFRHFPLSSIHQKAQKAAEASLAAAQEGKFWEMHNELFANRHSLGVISLKGHARDVGVKSKRFLDELISGYYGVYVRDDIREGMRLGVTDAPTFFINGERIVGDPTYKNISSYIKKFLDEENSAKSTLKKAA